MGTKRLEKGANEGLDVTEISGDQLSGPLHATLSPLDLPPHQSWVSLQSQILNPSLLSRRASLCKSSRISADLPPHFPCPPSKSRVCVSVSLAHPG